MKSYEVYELATNKLVGYVELKHYNCKHSSYIAKATNKTYFLYSPNIHYIQEIKLFQTADSSCADLAPEQCDAWKKLLNKPGWSSITVLHV